MNAIVDMSCVASTLDTMSYTVIWETSNEGRHEHTVSDWDTANDWAMANVVNGATVPNVDFPEVATDAYSAGVYEGQNRFAIIINNDWI